MTVTTSNERGRKSADDWLVTISGTGAVTMRGGLIFHSGGFLYVEQRKGVRPIHQFDGNHFIGHLPKWWQIIRWWRLIRLIREHMKT